MSLAGKLIREIKRSDILALLNERAAEDWSLEFKERLFAGPQSTWDQEWADVLDDIVAFANARGGHIVFGIREEQHRAAELQPVDSNQAQRKAVQLRQGAARHIHPGLERLDIQPIQVDRDGKQWVVIAAIPEGSHKPYMNAFRERTRFTLRISDGKRDMSYEEIQAAFLGDRFSQEAVVVRKELESIRRMLQELNVKMGERG